MSDSQPLLDASKDQPAFIRSETFPVGEGDLLKIRAIAIDADEAVNERALVCTIRFFDGQGALIEQTYEGVSKSAVYGSYVYVASKRDNEATPWIKEVIVAPDGARSLEIRLYPWKTSPEIKVVGAIECLDIRRIPTDEISWNLSAKESRSETYEVLPFWRSLFSFDVLRKKALKQDGIRIEIRFLGRDANPLEVNSVVSSSIVGMVDAAGKDVLVVTPVAQKCEYQDYERLIALIQLVPPGAAVSAVVTLANDDEIYSVRVSQRIFAFETLIESRLAADSGALIVQAAKLPDDLGQLSFAKLAEKRPDDFAVFDATLEYYLARGNIKKITATANNILNRFQDASLCMKARNALALVKETMPSWRPCVSRIERGPETRKKDEFQPKVGHLLRYIDIENNDTTSDLGWDLVSIQKTLDGNWPFVVLPLGYPEKGEQGLPWERRVHENIACYYLNCLSVEQLQPIPVTAQLNFAAVLAADIFANEGAELIHVQEGERGYDLALVGLAIASAMRIPLVYQKLDAGVNATSFSAPTHSLSQARTKRDHQCMLDADAIIVTSEAQRSSLADIGIAAEKMFVWPDDGYATAADDDADAQNTKIADMCRVAYAYAQSACRKKYGY
ncbi:hypothetical protein TKWG_23335 [Advenella kashmirensis WT001]|uniref:Uncharacterized protein n=1 Tax=Advenella kashmirensis (strain DSM 17095 / LMG 22695 / WT001) TaxID=1036672 RepID=I3UGX6_ADVKW|nr:glycosyltransferase family 4 protein [Advenella kashmirensis]AFK64264.1 hypothetical protein TKWG_23335 [Advenella kashmirensis WT001]